MPFDVPEEENDIVIQHQRDAAARLISSANAELLTEVVLGIVVHARDASVEDEVEELCGYWNELEHALGKLSRLTSVKVTGLQMGGLERMSTFTETLPSRYHNCIRSKLRSIDQRGILTFGTSYEGLR